MFLGKEEQQCSHFEGCVVYNYTIGYTNTYVTLHFCSIKHLKEN